MPNGPCEICGEIDYALSFGGPDICPTCDCGDFGPARVRAQGELIRELRAELATALQLVRIDQALARQLQQSIEANSKLREEMRRTRELVQSRFQT